MAYKLIITPKFIISATIFLIVCCFGSNSESISPKNNLQDITIKKHNLHMIAVENNTNNCEFQTFYGADAANCFVAPNSTFYFSPDQEIPLDSNNLLMIKCCKGSFLPVYARCQGVASGELKQGYDGPFYLSMWLAYPQVYEDSKINIRYYVKNDAVGKIRLKIGQEGDYRFVADENISFIE